MRAGSLRTGSRCGAAGWMLGVGALLVVLALPAAAAVRRSQAPAPGTWAASYDWTGGSGYAGWRSLTSAADGMYGASAGLGAGRGLWLWPTGGATYGPGWIQWQYDAPGTTTIMNASVTLAVSPALYAHHCVSVRLQSSGRDVAVQSYCKPISGAQTATVSIADPAAASTSLVLRLEFPACKDPASSSCAKNIPANDPATGLAVNAQAVQLTLKDATPPSIALSGRLPALAGHFVDGTATYDFGEAVTDDGSGVSRAWVDVPLGSTFASADAPCDPTHQTPALGGAICPPSFTLAGTYDTTKLPEGPSTFSAQARDYAQNTAAASWTLYVDRTPPTIDASGPLRDLARHFVDGTQTYQLALAATDPGADTHKASGIARAWVERDGPATLSAADDGACTDLICPSAFAPTLAVDTSSFPEGRNTLIARTRDLVGHESATDPWLVYVDRTPPTPSVSGPFADLATTYISGRRSYDVTLRGLDPGADADRASGIRNLQLLRTGAAAPLVSRDQACTDLICPADATSTATVDTTGFPEGANTFVVQAADLVGHTAVSGSWTILVDRTAPSVPQNLALYNRDDSAGTAEIGWDPSVDPALGDGAPGSGVHGYAYRTRVDGGSWSAWQQTGSFTASVAGVSSGDSIGLEVHSLDGAGNASTDASATRVLPATTPPPVAEDQTNPPPADPGAGELVQPWTDPQLTASQSTDAATVAAADPRVAAVLAAGPHTADDTSAWRMDRQPTLLGATVHFTFDQPTTITGQWLLVSYDGSETAWPPYTTVTDTETVPNVIGVTVDIDLRTNTVVGIEPEASADTGTAFMRMVRAAQRINRLHGVRHLSMAEASSGGRATSNLRPICIDAGLCFYNYDFDTKDATALAKARYLHVDMPVTMIYYGGANVDAVNQGLQSFEPGSGNPMEGRVWDRSLHQWYDSTTGGRKFHSCDFWKHTEHTRFYGDSSGSMFSLHYGYVVVGTTHRDWYECLPFVTSRSGESEQGEKGIISGIVDPVQRGLNPALAGWKVKEDVVNLHNKEGWPNTYSVGSHPLHNDGLASLIWLPGGPVDENGNPPVCTTCNPPPDTGGGGPVVEVQTRRADTPNDTWVSWNSFENGSGSIAFCRAHFVPAGSGGPTGEFTIDTGPAGGPQLWHTGPGTLTFTCWDTHDPQRASSAAAETY